MITVETRPERMTAVQWHQPGDARELGETSYRIATELRHGIPSMDGMQRLHPGDWVVASGSKARVYSNGEFHHRFKIVEEDIREQAGS